MKFYRRRRNKMKKILILILTLCSFSITIFSVDLKEIVAKLDNNEVFKSIKYEGKFIIYNNSKKYEKSFYSYAKGNRDYYMEFTNSGDKGTKYLKYQGTLYVYTDDLENYMAITGHMLKESIMGSDLSYEDAVNNDTLESQYNYKLLEESVFNGETVFKGKPCWVIEFTAKTKTVSYAKRIIWVDKETCAALKEELFALGGATLKENLLLNARWIGDRYFTTELQMRDLLRKNSKTVFTMDKIELDINVPEKYFSLSALKK
jgi:outer membrane lipoprotein-sorting protein